LSRSRSDDQRRRGASKLNPESFMTTIFGLSKPLHAIAFAVSLGAATIPQAGTAAPGFDGAWAVKIVAESGECSTRMTVPIEVSGGRIRYTGSFSAVASGAVGANGRLNVRFAHSDDVVNARGALKGGSGYGSWKSPTKNCGGTWTARRA
jgi:hypothetical protein